MGVYGADPRPRREDVPHGATTACGWAAEGVQRRREQASKATETCSHASDVAKVVARPITV